MSSYKEIIEKKKVTKNYKLSTNLKWDLFLLEYLNNGFHGIDAYQKVYGVSRDSARCLASNLLANIDFLNLLCQELERRNIADIASKEFCLHEALTLLRTCKSEQVKARMVEFIGKCSGIGDDQRIQVAVFGGIEKDLPILPVVVEAAHNKEVTCENDVTNDKSMNCDNTAG